MPEHKRVVVAKYRDEGKYKALGIVMQLDDPRTDPIDAIRSASTDFARTEDGRRVVERNGGDFNYGDFVDEVPEETCLAHGFVVLDTFVTDLVVDHDERLVQD